MALPTIPVAAVENSTGGTTNITYTLPAHIADDILLLIVESTTSDLGVPAGWAHVTGSPLAGTGTVLNVMWLRAAGSGTTNPLVTVGTSNHQSGSAHVIRGCKTSGNPWNGTPQTSVEATVDTSVSITGYTTTAADCLVFAIGAFAIGNATTADQVSAPANANLGSVTERSDTWTTAGNDGGTVAISGTLAIAGATGNTTCTLTTGSAKAMITVAFEPPSAGGTAFTRSQPEPVSITDTVTTIESFVRTRSEPLALSDLVQRVAGFARSRADSLDIIDVVLRVVGFPRQISDNLGLSDSVTAVLSRIVNRSQSDPINITDTVQQATTYKRSVSDPLALSDLLVRKVTHRRSLPEPVGLLDQVLRTIGFVRTISDTVGLTDLAEHVLARIIARSQSEAVGLVDAITRVLKFGRSISETIGLTDVVSKVLRFGRTITDPVAITDNVTATLTSVGGPAFRSLTDAITMTDMVVRIVRGEGGVMEDSINTMVVDRLRDKFSIDTSIQDLLNIFWNDLNGDPPVSQSTNDAMWEFLEMFDGDTLNEKEMVYMMLQGAVGVGYSGVRYDYWRQGYAL